MGFEHVVSSRVFITDATKFQEMNKAYVPYFPKDPPARATVVAPLMAPQFQVEITLTASRLPKIARYYVLVTASIALGCWDRRRGPPAAWEKSEGTR